MHNIAEMVDRILDLSKQNGMTGEKLGTLLGLKKSPLTDWKNLKSKPTVSQLVKLCEIFAVDSNYLLFGRTNNVKQVEILEDDIQELVSNYKNLDRRGKYRVHTIAYEELDRMNGQTTNQATSQLG